MSSTRAGIRGAHLALGVVLMAAILALAGCGATAASPADATHKPAHAAKTPTPQKTASHYTTQSTAAGYVYTDELSGYAVTFADEPVVKPLAITGTDRLGNAGISSDMATDEYLALGEVRDSPPDLRGELMAWVQSVKTSGQIGASSYQLGGLDAARAEFTLGEDPQSEDFLTGQQGETVVAGKGTTFYQLIALGGTPAERQAFFDSFTPTDG